MHFNCSDLIERWLIEPELAERLVFMESVFQEESGLGLEVISGFRCCERRPGCRGETQQELEARGRPTAPCDLSNHTVCPARAADLRVSGAMPTTSVKQRFGAAAFLAGLRWGGGSPVNAQGIPSDWNHVDLGPRRSG